MEAVVRELIEGVKDDFVFPDVAARAVKMIDDENTTAYDLAEVIAYDPYLASSLLRIVNSPLYGFRREINNLYEAISLLGFEEVRKNLITVTIKSMFREADVYDKYIWEHSLGVAVAAPLFRDCIGCKAAMGTVYLMGLLHDMGKMVLKRLNFKDYRAILRECYSEGVECVFVEREKLGFTHAEVGGVLLENWGLPEEIVEVVAYHHSDSDKDTVELIKCCDSMVNALGIGRPTPLGDVSDVIDRWQCVGDPEEIESEIRKRIESIEVSL